MGWFRKCAGCEKGLNWLNGLLLNWITKKMTQLTFWEAKFWCCGAPDLLFALLLLFSRLQQIKKAQFWHSFLTKGSAALRFPPRFVSSEEAHDAPEKQFPLIPP